MTEAEWRACDDPGVILEFLKPKTWDARDNRKLRLLRCACCRRLWHLLDERSQKSIEAAELRADEQIDEQTLAESHGAAWEIDTYGIANSNAAIAAARASECMEPQYGEPWTDTINVLHVANIAVQFKNQSDAQAPDDCAYAREKQVQAAICRDVFRNPCQAVVRIDRVWISSTVLELAKAIYADRAFDRLPILADALEDAGCTDRDILDHCRQPGDHARGCWVVDLVLGKS